MFTHSDWGAMEKIPPCPTYCIVRQGVMRNAIHAHSLNKRDKEIVNVLPLRGLLLVSGHDRVTRVTGAGDCWPGTGAGHWTLL